MYLEYNVHSHAIRAVNARRLLRAGVRVRYTRSGPRVVGGGSVESLGSSGDDGADDDDDEVAEEAESEATDRPAKRVKREQTDETDDSAALCADEVEADLQAMAEIAFKTEAQ